jgi:hypothetical protein
MRTTTTTTTTTPSPYRAFLFAVRNAARAGVVDSVEMRSAFDERANSRGCVEPAEIEWCAARVRAGVSVLFSDSALSTTPDDSALPRGW